LHYQWQFVFKHAMNCDPESALRIRDWAPLLTRWRVGLVWILVSLALAGCGGCGGSGPASQPPVWVERDIAHNDLLISLGYRGEKPQAGQAVEPVAMITRAGQPAADAMVFVSLASDQTSESGLADTPTVYEPPAGRSPGVYAQAKLQVPAGSAQCPVRFRIVLGEGEQDWTREIKIPLK
jgi:hypothetical protein